MRRVPTLVAPLTLLAASTAGCADRTVAEVPPVQSQVEQKDIPLVINRLVDVLFVIDNSDSMSDEQTSLRANFDRFIDVLDNIDGGLPDVHIGVATSDMGSLGVIASGPCAGMGDAGQLHVGAAVIANGDRYLSDVAGPTPGTRITNYDQGGAVSLTTAFGQIADVGTDGCPFEQHLASMQAALEPGANGTFLRPDAHLAVIVLADEDDCSAQAPELFEPNPALGPLDSFRCFEYGVECDEPDPRAPGPRTNCRPLDPSPYLTSPDQYIDFVRGLKANPDDVIVAAIAGDRTPVSVGTRMVGTETRPTLNQSCTYDSPDPAAEDQTADPAIRIGTFVDGFTTHGRQTTICADNLSGALAEVGDLVAENLGNSCIENQLADTDPSTPELDYECSVRLVSGPHDIDTFDVVVPECDAGATVQPCWRLVQNARCASYPTGLSLELVRSVEPPATARINASCVVE